LLPKRPRNGPPTVGRTGAAVYLLLAYGLTLPALFIAEEVAPSADLVATLKLACIAVFVWHAATVVRGRPGIASTLALAIATGLVWTAVLVIYLYKVVTMMPLDFAMVLLSLGDAGRTLEHVLGKHGVPEPADYDDCKLLSEPHQRLIVRRGGERAEFRFGAKPLVISEAGAGTTDFWTFHDRFACK
jgi:hypothetical protein